ncbi:hypothetical protein ACVBEF_17070, partial [Glaciimonas sp. GG7]
MKNEITSGPMDEQQFRDQILLAAGSGTALQIRGGGTKDWYGQTPQGALLDTRAYSGIIEYEPTIDSCSMNRALREAIT